MARVGATAGDGEGVVAVTSPLTVPAFGGEEGGSRLKGAPDHLRGACSGQRPQPGGGLRGLPRNFATYMQSAPTVPSPLYQ